MAEKIDPLDIDVEHVGQYLRVETKVKSKPILGRITNVVNRSKAEGGGMVRVEIQGAFGTRTLLLTADNETSLED